MRLLATTSLYLACLTVAARAQAPPAATHVKRLEIPRISSKPLISEFLEGHSRADMKQFDDFRQRNPGDGIPVSRPTKAWIAYDDQNIYAVFVCQSPSGRTRARFSKREDILNDDMVGLFLDTWLDRQRSYEFFVNPLGIQADAITTEGQNDDFSFDTLWYSDGRLTPDGFVVTMAIPFKSLRFNSADVQTWGLGLGRFIPENNESSFWPYITQKVSGFAPQLGIMTGLTEISPGRNIRFTPYGAFGQSHFLDNPSNGIPSFKGKTDFRAGFDAKAVIHDSLTLDVAVNPDFSQVESDDPQVTVNQRFEVQFPEKRPFFLENAAFFSTPENLFFSRRIIDPEFGARLTGKIGRWSLGILAIDDRSPGTRANPLSDDAGKRAEIGIIRVQREFSKESSIGMFFSDREFNGASNRVAAIDTRLKLNGNWTFKGQAISSQTTNADGSRTGGDAFSADLNGSNRKWFYDLTYTDRSEGFNAQLGYIQRTNIRQAQQFVSRHFRPKGEHSRLVSISPNLYMSGDFDHRNVQQDWSFRPGVNMEFARSTFIGSSFGESFERFGGLNFLTHSFGSGAHSEYFKKAIVDLNYSQGTRINYSPAGNNPAFLARGNEFQGTLTLRPISRLKLDEIYYMTRLYTGGPRIEAIFLNHLVRSRANYQFSKELSLRVIMDYNGVLQNPALINLDRQKRVTGDVLMTYLIHPGTAFYLGYTDTHENLSIFNGGVTRTGFPSTTSGRQVFAKLSYQFRF